MTAHPGHKRRALEAGERDFINKPFNAIEVLTRVYNLLELRQAGQLPQTRSRSGLRNT